MTDSAAPDRVDTKVLREIERRVLWLAISTVPNAGAGADRDAGRAAAAASTVSILTSLCFGHMDAGDRVSIPPAAAPLAGAIRALVSHAGPGDRGDDERRYPDFCDVREGWGGSALVGPIYAAAARRHVDRRFGARPKSRFVGVVDENELGSGSVWEAVDDPLTRGLGNVVLVVDLSRQQRGGVVPDERARRLRRFFSDAGWHVLEARYGHLLNAAFSRPNGDALRHHIDSLSNETYQELFTTRGAELRRRFLYGADPTVVEMIEPYDDRALADLVFNVGGHDVEALLDCFVACDTETARPSVVFAHTVKGWSLPMAGSPDHHRSVLTEDQVEQMRAMLGIESDSDPSHIDPDGDAGRICRALAGRGLNTRVALPRLTVPASTGVVRRESRSGPTAFADSVSGLSRSATLGARLVTTAERRHSSAAAIVEQIVRPEHHEWAGSGSGLIELAAALGHAHRLHDQSLVPIALGCESSGSSQAAALAEAISVGSRFVYVSVARSESDRRAREYREAMAELSVGPNVDGIWTAHPVFPIEVDWVVCETVRRLFDPGGGASCLRISPRTVDPEPLARTIDSLGEEETRRRVLAGAIRLVDPSGPSEARITLVSSGPTITEAVAAAEILELEGVATALVHMSAPGPVRTSWLRSSHEAAARGRRRETPDALSEIVSPQEPRHPLVTIGPRTAELDWLGSALTCPQTALTTGDVDSVGGEGLGAWGPTADLLVNAGLVAVDEAGHSGVT